MAGSVASGGSHTDIADSFSGSRLHVSREGCGCLGTAPYGKQPNCNTTFKEPIFSDFMKISRLAWITSPLILAAGCSYQDHGRAQYDDTMYLPGYITRSGVSRTGVDYGGSRSDSYASSPSAAYSPTESEISGGGWQDVNLETQVRRALTEDSGVAALAPTIGIAANSGMVTLSGSVSTTEQKQNVESIVWKTPGVSSVDNRLQVAASAGAVADALSATSREDSGPASATSNYIHEPGTGNRLSTAANATSVFSTNNLTGINAGSAAALTNASANTAISNHVENATAQSPQNDLNRIDVVTGEGAESGEPLEATSTRSGQANVYPGVTNSITDEASGGQSGGVNITVQGTSAGDQTLAQQIRQELQTDASLASAISLVNISVTDGRVALRGTVKNEVQKREIEAAIQRATGVSSVDNQLRVSSTGTVPVITNPQP